ncbi:MAG: peroxiredoxin [Devosia sp.]|uniref:peroxiredoxin n=1 Tax=Devosia sp. TaxID=1871048 RepID=UPI001A55C4FF|nr:peroxiredoxin [Devosia sp.]MBL8596690.1 peroxiredoxin [Devosia sp.]
MLEIGQRAPDFTLPDDRGGSFKLSAHRGKPVVVEFYCEDGTEGCEIENREFSALAPAFRELGVEVVGISPQDVDSHKKFAAKNKFAHPLLADTELTANKAYDVWQQKKLWGREYMGTIRVTYLVDAKGKIAGVFHARRIKGHAQAVLDAAKAHLADAR